LDQETSGLAFVKETMKEKIKLMDRELITKMKKGPAGIMHLSEGTLNQKYTNLKKEQGYEES
jgi:hypothetical protein